ncbi:DNA-dependent RNA polymerase beta' subunit/160 kD subunit, partial [Giardia duodenalis]
VSTLQAARIGPDSGGGVSGELLGHPSSLIATGCPGIAGPRPDRWGPCQRVSLQAPLPGCSECVPPDGLLTRGCCTTTCRSLVDDGESEYSNVQNRRDGHSSRSDPTSHAIPETTSPPRRPPGTSQHLIRKTSLTIAPPDHSQGQPPL